MKKFDCILFENMITAYHHLKDVKIIADMLLYSGKDVAIYDIYEQKKYIPNSQNVPIFEYTNKYSFSSYFDKNRIGVSIYFFYVLAKKRYLKQLLKDTKDITNSYYVGSYGTSITSVFLKSEKPCFFWGLRSHYMNVSYWLRRNPIVAYLVWKNKRLFLKGNNYLFVSDKFIENEFKVLGIPENRLIRREERVVKTNITNNLFSSSNTVFRFLVIGQLRPSKRVEIIVDAFNKMNASSCTLLVVGRTNNEYEKIIDTRICKNDSVTRINKFLEEDEYNSMFINSNCTIFGDKQQQFAITNGTFIESLMHYRPVIAPNYNPYKYYIEKFGVGLLFDPDNMETLVHAMVKIQEMGTNAFHNNISSFLQTLQFENVAKSFNDDLLRKVIL